MKRIVTEFVPQHKQRYDTIGDYGETEHNNWFRITEFKDHPGYAIAALIHELHERYRCEQLGILLKDIDDFDLSHPELDDPGFSPEAPYHKPHMEADALERMVIMFFGEDWIEYEAAINKLFNKERPCKCP